MATFLHEYFTLALAKNISEENVGAWSLNIFHFFMNDPNFYSDPQFDFSLRFRMFKVNVRFCLKSEN